MLSKTKTPACEAPPYVLWAQSVHRRLTQPPTSSRFFVAGARRPSSAQALASVAPGRQDAVAALVETLKEEDPAVHGAAVRSLQRLPSFTGDPEQAVSQWTRQLKEGDPETRLAAANGLARLGLAARSAVPELVGCLENPDENEEVRHAAAMTLGLIGPAAEGAVPILIQTVQGRGSARLRAGAATALGLIGPAAKAAVLPLVDSLQSDEPEFRAAVIMALERIGPRPKALVPKLLEALRGDDVEVRGSATSLIRSFAEERARGWMPLLANAHAPVVRNWLLLHGLYGVDDLDVPSRAGQTASADAFDLLGGRAAVRETLQIQLLNIHRLKGGGLVYD